MCGFVIGPDRFYNRMKVVPVIVSRLEITNLCCCDGDDDDKIVLILAKGV